MKKFLLVLAISLAQPASAQTLKGGTETDVQISKAPLIGRWTQRASTGFTESKSHPWLHQNRKKPWRDESTFELMQNADGSINPPYSRTYVRKDYCVIEALTSVQRNAMVTPGALRFDIAGTQTRVTHDGKLVDIRPPFHGTWLFLPQTDGTMIARRSEFFEQEGYGQPFDEITEAICARTEN